MSDPTSPLEPPAPAPETPALAFVDVDGAKAWANALPYGNVARHHDAVFGQLRALAAAELGPRERATIAEIMRGQVAHLHTELARRYAGKPQPADERERQAVEQAIALWDVLLEQYSRCLKPLLEGDPALTGVRPKLLQRGLYVGKQLVLVHGLARRAFPPALWLELHAYYQLAEALECAVTAVSDDLLPRGIGICCYSTYTHSLLLALADPYAMSVKQIELTDRWLAMWARKVFPYAQQRESEGPFLVVDLDSNRGAALVTQTPAEPPLTMRFGYPTILATSVRGRLQRLQSGASPAKLHLGRDCSVEQCTTLLGHLDQRWSQSSGGAAASDGRPLDLCAGGVPAAYYRIRGRTFGREDPLARGYKPRSQHFQTLGAVTDYDPGREDAERTWAWERWLGAGDWREAALQRSGAAVHRWALGQLAVVRDGDRKQLGHVTRVMQDADGSLSLSLRMWTASPQGVAVRPLSAARLENSPLPALFLAATPEETASLCVPPRTFSPGRVLRTIDPGTERKFRLTRLLQRGADFERLAFEEAT